MASGDLELLRQTLFETMQEIAQSRKSPTIDDIADLMYAKGVRAIIQSATDKCPFTQIMTLYNSICVSLPKIVGIDGKRREAVLARYKKYQSIDKFEELFKIAEASDFLKGENRRNWRADFDWLMKPTNMPKVLERRYDNRTISAANDVENGFECCSLEDFAEGI